MDDVGSTLVAHCGARKVTREELKDIPVPKALRLINRYLTLRSLKF